MTPSKSASVPTCFSLLRQILLDNLRLLSFRAPSATLAQRPWAYLVYALLVTWLVGIGRYWDHPDALGWQYLGLGSVAYVFILALILWLFVWPLRPRRWTYQNVLLFVCLTSPPALLYAIPVERFMALGLAQSVNAWFLAIVASWRVGLLYWFLRRLAGLRADFAIVACLLPLTLILVTLAMLDLEHTAFQIMAGMDRAQTANDTAHGIVTMIAMLAMLASPVLVIAYVGYIWLAWRERR
jgi:hypothetical protein